MKKSIALSIVVLLGILLAGPVLAGGAKTVTLEGTVVCAKCTLHEEGQGGCQNVLVVEKKGKEKHYYLAESAAHDEFGGVCSAKVQVRVTGQVKKEDGAQMARRVGDHACRESRLIDPADQSKTTVLLP